MARTVATAQSPKPFPFFSLPRELRDQIYDEVWPASPFLYRATLTRERSPLIDITADYRKFDSDYSKNDSRLPQHMLVSKTFLGEAMEQFFRNVNWIAKIPASSFTTRIHLSNTGHHTRANTHMELELSFLANGNKLLRWIKNEDYSSTVIQVYQMWPMTLPTLRKFEKGLLEPDGRRTLHVAFGVAFERTKKIVKVDLSNLERIGFSLDKVIGHVTYTSTESDERVNNLY